MKPCLVILAVLPFVIAGRSNRASLLDEFALAQIPSSHSRSPFYALISPAIAKRVDRDGPDSIYRVNISGFVGQESTSSKLGSFFGSLIGNIFSDSAEDPRFKARMALLTLKASEKVSLHLSIGAVLKNGNVKETLVPVNLATGRKGGYFAKVVDVEVPLNYTTVEKLTVSFQEDVKKYSQVIGLAGQSGYSIISDIDDTIKVTGTLNRTKAVMSTLVEDFEAIPGMAEKYQDWYQGLQTKHPESFPTFHYVSGGFSKLLPLYQRFIEEGAKFPVGELRMTELTARNVFKASDVSRVYSFKKRTIAQIMSLQPSRKFLFVGDSTQSDPEVYGSLLSMFPDNISCVFIHIVKGYDTDKEARLNSQKRFRNAFTHVKGGVRSNKILLYRNASELPTSEDILKGKCQRDDRFAALS